MKEIMGGGKLNAYIVEFIKKTTGNFKEGSLVFIESNKHVDFEIKRVYYTYGAKNGIMRGFHAHKKLEQVLICVYGKIEVSCDDGRNKKTFILDDPSKGLYIGNEIWRTIKWLRDDSVLLVLASEYYTEEDYIRDYNTFLEYIKSKGGAK